jgi:hypothetical protein
MAAFERPSNPEYLRNATFRIFGEQCLRCGKNRPLEMAHIINWPRCVTIAGEEINGAAPPEAWHYAEAVRHFHHLGNVLPLCANCHTLYDGEQWEDVTESEIKGFRDTAVQETGVLLRLIDFVGTELSGRPNRCTHKVDGKRKHSHAVDVDSCVWPLIWISQGYELGLICEEPNLIVPTGPEAHYHVPLSTPQIRMCTAELSDCRQKGRIWKRL